jgi:hypothetical protein
MENMDHIEGTFYSDKEIAIEPDLGDLRKSTDKALPAPPTTPKRVLMKYRFSAIFPIAFAVASFVFTLVLVLAGSDEHIFGGQYIVAVRIPTLVGEGRMLTERSWNLPRLPEKACTQVRHRYDRKA